MKTTGAPLVARLKRLKGGGPTYRTAKPLESLVVNYLMHVGRGGPVYRAICGVDACAGELGMVFRTRRLPSEQPTAMDVAYAAVGAYYGYDAGEPSRWRLYSLAMLSRDPESGAFLVGKGRRMLRRGRLDGVGGVGRRPVPEPLFEAVWPLRGTGQREESRRAIAGRRELIGHCPNLPVTVICRVCGEASMVSPPQRHCTQSPASV